MSRIFSVLRDKYYMGHDVKFQLERKFDFFSMNEGHVYVSNEFTNDSLNLKYSRAESTASSGFPAVWGISCLILKQDLNPFLFFLLFLLSSSIPIMDFVFFTVILACSWNGSRLGGAEIYTRNLAPKNQILGWKPNELSLIMGGRV